MNRHACVVIVGVACLLGHDVATVFAELTSRSHPVHGTDVITFDSSTQLEWLDVNYTLGLSYSQITGQFAPTGSFAGFRHATDAEITTLFTNAGIPIVATDGFKPENYEPVRALQELVSSLSSPSGMEWSTRGFAAATVEPPTGFQSLLRFLMRDDSNQTAIANTLGTLNTDPNASHPLLGHWIVREVPEPSTLLSALAVLGIAVLRSRRAVGRPVQF